ADGVLERLKRKIDRDDLYYTALFNRAVASNGAAFEAWNKSRLWEYLVGEGSLRVMIVVAGAGPHAAGMPELRLSSPANPNLASIAVLVTDGRVSIHHAGVSVSHLVPEAIDGGPLSALRTGDWIYMDMARGDLQAVSQTRSHDGYKV